MAAAGPSSKIEIVVEARTAEAVAGMKRFGESTGKAKAQSEALAEAQRKNAREMDNNRARIENARDRISAFGAAVDRASKGMQGSSTSTVSFGSALAALRNPIAGGIAALGGLAIAANEVSKASLQTQAVFQNLEFSIEPARRATAGLVDDMTLATKANQASALGVARNADEFAKLAHAAQALGQKLGTSTEDAFESLVAAVGRGSSAMLDNLGIVVKQEQAQELYAAKLGKTKDQLTKTEQAEAFRKVALEKIFEAADKVNVVTDGAAAATQRYRVELENLKTSALGGTQQTLSLHAGLKQLTQAERDSAQQGRQYGAAIQDLKDRLSDLGVAYKDMPKSVDAWIKATDEASASIRRQALNAEIAARSVNGLKAQLDAVRSARKADDQLNERATQAGRLRDLEDTLAFEQSRGKNLQLISGLMSEQAELQAKFADDEGKHDKARDIRRQEELRLLKEQGASLKSATGAAGERLSLEERINDELYKRAKIQMQLERAGLSRFGPDASIDQVFGGTAQKRADAFFESERKDARKAAIAAQLQRDPESPQDKERERIKQLEEAKQAAEKADRARHQAELRRVKEKIAAQERLGAMVGGTIASLAQSTLASGDLSARGFKRVLAEWGKAESIRLASVAISEGVQALVALASFNYPQAVLHGTAAGSAAAAAAAIAGLTGAIGGFGSVNKSVSGGFTGAQFGGGASANDSGTTTTTVSNSQEDTVPLSPEGRLQQSGSTNASGVRRHGGGGNVSIGNITVLGAIDDQSATKIAQGITKAQRRVGKVA